MSVWPVLKSLPQTGVRVSFASSQSAGASTVRPGAPLALEGRVGVDHRGRDLRVVLGEALLEALEAAVDLRSLRERLGRGAPDDDRASDAALPLERLYVLHDLVRVIELGLGGLRVRAVELLHPVPVEVALHRLHGRKGGPRQLEVGVIEDACLLRGGVAVIGEDVPGRDLDVLDAGERDEVLDERAAVVGALAQADRPHLGERPVGLGAALLDGVEPRDHRGADRAEAHEQDPELALGGLYRVRLCGRSHVASFGISLALPTRVV
jgi:hypothetical protein